MMLEKKVLYIVATPLGNLGDMTARALETLKNVDWIAAEDTRHSQQLLTHFGIKKSLLSLHEHNEQQKAHQLLNKVLAGSNLAIITDAGTPLICDPGYYMVRLAFELGIKVVPIPGPSALIAALSVSGLPSDRFIFEGFLPAKTNARCQRLEILSREPRTLIFYEAPHRMLATLEDMVKTFGENREATIARELTKNFETIRKGPLRDLLDWSKRDPNQQRGEFVIMIKGYEKENTENLSFDAEHILKVLLSELPVKQAAALTHSITGISKRQLYDYALKEKGKKL